MIATYNFNYDHSQAEVTFTVDTSVFTEEYAKITLDFFGWEIDEDENIIDEVMKHYALRVIQVATIYSLSAKGVISHFSNDERGFAALDGSRGVQLQSVDGYEFQMQFLEMNLKK